jgi:hypothetical protein
MVMKRHTLSLPVEPLLVPIFALNDITFAREFSTPTRINPVH